MTFKKFILKHYNLDSRGQSSLETPTPLQPTLPRRWKGGYSCPAPTAAAKTHLAVSIVGQCIRKGYPSLFAFVPDLLDHLRAAFSPDSPVRYDQLFDQVKSVPLLILDDLGAESSTSWAKEKLYQIVVHRHNARMPTVITTYLSMEEIRAEQPHLASRLLDATLVNWVPIGAPDYRNQGRIDQQGSNSRRF